MICGGTGTPAIYTAKRLAHVADYEVHVNSRFVSELQRFVSEARQAGEEGKFRAGRVSAFLEHVPPGYEDTHPDRELSTLRQMMEVPNEPGLSPNNGLENALLSDQSMASNPRKGQAKRSGAKTTSHDGKAGHVMTHVCHCVLQED
ncbi:TPA: hypothetical protein ACH3X2_012530 [Trebouxia sp. C0005]